MEEKETKPTLPSNYVTLVQLQERWLKQQQSKIIQPQPQQQQPPNQNHPQHHKLIAPIDGNTCTSRPQKQYVVKNRTEEDNRKLEIAAAGIGDETADPSGKVSVSKKKKSNRKWKSKTKTEKRGPSADGSGTAQGNEEGKKKATIENDLNEEEIQAEQSARVSPVQQRLRVLTIKSGNDKQNGRLGKMSNGFRHYRYQRKKHDGEAQGIEEAEKKAAIENEPSEENNGGSVTAEEEVVNRSSVRVLTINSGNLGKKTSNDFGDSQSQRKKHYVEAHVLKEKKNVGSVTVEEAEERVRVLSINSGDVEQNNVYRHSQPWRRKYYGGEASHGYGYGYGDRNRQHYSKVRVQRREEKMVWVKKDEIVG